MVNGLVPGQPAYRLVQVYPNGCPPFEWRLLVGQVVQFGGLEAAVVYRSADQPDLYEVSQGDGLSKWFPTRAAAVEGPLRTLREESRREVEALTALADEPVVAGGEGGR